MIDITGYSKAAVLAALYNASHPLGMGFMHFDPEPMTEADAEAVIADGDDHAAALAAIGAHRPSLYFDYVKGRVMKVDIAGDTLDPRLYDRDNGDGAAARAIAAIR